MSHPRFFSARRPYVVNYDVEMPSDMEIIRAWLRGHDTAKMAEIFKVQEVLIDNQLWFLLDQRRKSMEASRGHRPS